jgi:hypothetical protein
MKTSTHVLVSLACSAAVVGGYHALLAPPRPTYAVSNPDRDVDDALASMRAEIASLRDEVRGYAVAGTAGAGEAAARAAGALVGRVEALEGRLVGGDPLARTLPLGGERPGDWTEQQIQDFRTLLETVEYRRTSEQEIAGFRRMVATVDPNLSPADVTATTSLLANFIRSVRGVFADASARETPEGYAATMAKATELRQKLAAELKQILRPETAEKVLERMPAFDGSHVRSPAAREYNAAMEGAAMEDPPK